MYKGGPHGAAKLGAGVFAYSALSAFGDGVGHLLSPSKAAQDVPELRTENLKAVAVYGDDQMNDSRMALMTVRAAVESGAVVLNHSEVTGLRFTRGRVTGAELRDQLSGDEFGVNARLVLNATGPWVDHLRRMENPDAAPSIRLSKGAHLVLKRTAPWKAALATLIDKYRITFALPWEDMLLLGTTDEVYEGDPADVAVNDKDIAQILDEAAFSIRDQQLDRDLITYSFAGLRVLPGGPGDTAKAKRETVVTEGRAGMLSVAGGKWTTFRHIGRTIMKKLEALPGHPWVRTSSRSARCRRGCHCRGSPTRARSPTGSSSTTRRPAPAWAPTPRGTWPRTTGRWPSTSPVSPTRTPSWASVSTRTPLRSGRRSSTPVTPSGPRRPTTCCAAGRR